jgi:hypothetical protein
MTDPLQDLELDANDRWLMKFMSIMMQSINTVHDFISTCAYAREIRDKEN